MSPWLELAMLTHIPAVDEYLSRLTIEKRLALEKLRRDIEPAVPDGQECISYGVPGVRVNGKLLVAYGAAQKHCAFYAGAHPIEMHKAELLMYKTSKGTIRFQPGHPLPAPLVRKLVKTRIAEYTAARATGAKISRP